MAATAERPVVRRVVRLGAHGLAALAIPALAIRTLAILALTLLAFAFAFAVEPCLLQLPRQSRAKLAPALVRAVSSLTLARLAVPLFTVVRFAVQARMLRGLARASLALRLFTLALRLFTRAPTDDAAPLRNDASCACFLQMPARFLLLVSELAHASVPRLVEALLRFSLASAQLLLAAPCTALASRSFAIRTLAIRTLA